MNDAAHRRVAATLRHVLGGDESPAAPGGALSRSPTGSPAGPLLTPADVPALTRMLDHDNHDMREAMKRFMKNDLFLPVSASAGAPRDGVSHDAWVADFSRRAAPALRHAAARGARAGAGAAVAGLRAALLFGTRPPRLRVAARRVTLTGAPRPRGRRTEKNFCAQICDSRSSASSRSTRSGMS